MPLLRLRQSNFNGGEVGPYMVNRTTNKLYASSAEKVENWLLIPHGCIMRRLGFQFVDDLHLLDFTPIEIAVEETSDITIDVTVT